MPFRKIASSTTVGCPKFYDDLEIATFFCDGRNRGLTTNAIAKELANLMFARSGIADTRESRAKKLVVAQRLVKAEQRASRNFLLPWTPELGKGVHALSKPGLSVSFGEPMFLGRRLPKPIAIEPRVKRGRGRPKKQKD